MELNPIAVVSCQLSTWAQKAQHGLQQHPLSRALASWHQAQQGDQASHVSRIAFSSRSPAVPAGRRIVVLPRHAAVAAILPGDSVTEQVITSGLISFLSLYNTALICRLVLTWFPNPPEFIVGPLSTIADPYLNLFRGLIPPLGGTLDLSPILAFIVLNLFTNTAQALPAEVDGPAATATGGKAIGPYAGSNFVSPVPVSKTQQAWGRRVAVSKALKAASDGSSNPQ